MDLAIIVALKSCCECHKKKQDWKNKFKESSHIVLQQIITPSLRISIYGIKYWNMSLCIRVGRLLAIAKELTKTLWAKWIPKGMPTKAITPTMEVTVLFIKVDKSVFIIGNIDDHQFISSYVFVLGNGTIGCSNMIESLKVKLCQKRCHCW